MNEILTVAVFVGVVFLAIFVGNVLGFWRNVPRIDECDDIECVRTGKCQSGDCQ